MSIPGARRARLILGALAIALLLCVLLNLGVGAYAIEPAAVLRIVAERLGLAGAAAGVDAVQSSVFWNIRLPRVLLALLAGAGLAMSGGAVQGLFRNPLAEPGLLGVSAGASLFVALFILLREGIVGQALGAFGMPLAGFVGASVTLFAIYRLGTCAGQTAVATLLLAGVAINALCGAVLGLLIFMANDQQLRDITFWTMGSLAGATWAGLGWVSLLAVPALFMLARLARPLNAMLLGESEAGHLGCHVQGVKRLIVLGVGLIVGGVVALSGSIGFVGLIVPHLARMLIGADHRRMLPAAALMGGALLLLADLVARTIAAPLDLPIGVITTFAGAPFFLVMLLRGRREVALMLRVTDLGFTIAGACLLEGVSFALGAGETLAVVGPNGAGKTTLLRLLTGELQATAGRMEWDGRPFSSIPLRERARRRAVLPQQSALTFDFDVFEVVLLGRMPHGRRESPRDLAIAHEALAAVGAEGLAARRCPTLSGGERQRVQLARALAQIWEAPRDGRGRLLLLDEPTSALDVGHQQQILDLARGFATQGVAIVAVLHDLNLAARGFDRVLLLERGRPRACAPASDVLTPQCVEHVFGLPVHVLRHPDDGGPLVVPRESIHPLQANDRRSLTHDHDDRRPALRA